MTPYRVLDCVTGVETIIEAGIPEQAAQMVLGFPVIRGANSRPLRAKVYFERAGSGLTMVRMYAAQKPEPDRERV